MTLYTFRIFWSVEDMEWVAKCDQFESLSYMAHDPCTAMEGLHDLMELDAPAQEYGQ